MAMHSPKASTSEHLRRVEEAFREAELRKRAIRLLNETLEARYGMNRSQRRQERQWWLQREPSRRELEEFYGDLIRSWPADVREYLWEHLSDFSPFQRQQVQQQQQQVTQRKESEQEYQQQQNESRPSPLSKGDLAEGVYNLLPYYEDRAKADLVRQTAIRNSVQEVDALANKGTTAVRVAGDPDPLNVAVYAPKEVKVGDEFLLDVWTFLSGQRAKVKNLARRAGGIQAGEETNSLIERGAVLTLEMEIPGRKIENSVRTFVWTGTETCESFICSMEPQGYGQSTYSVRGNVVLKAGGSRIASADFYLRVSDKTAEEKSQVSERCNIPTAAFASYASDDRIEVMRGVEGLRKAAPHMDIFIDVTLLRSGEDWKRKIEAYISVSDIFYLFWSSAAARSEWVEKEWRFALATKGLSFIDPFPLESPEIVPRPKIWKACISIASISRASTQNSTSEADGLKLLIWELNRHASLVEPVQTVGPRSS